MRAKDIMTTGVVTVDPEMPVREVAALLLDRRISGAPVADAQGRLLGMIGESDLVHRLAAAGPRRRSWWHTLIARPENDPEEFVRVHGMRAGEIMTRDVITVSEETAVEEIARIMEERRIRRVPVVRDGRLAGIVSRADLLRVLVAAPPQTPATVDDEALRQRVVDALARQEWAHVSLLSVAASDGVVHLSGFMFSERERPALVVAVEEVPGVRRVVDELQAIPRTTSAL